MTTARTALLRCGLGLLAFGAGLWLASSGLASRARTRNAVLIVLDTLRADHLSSYGYGRPTSPNLDAFGKANARFAQAHSQAGCTYPSMNSLLTSRSPFQFLGQKRRHIGIPTTVVTLAQLLHARGLRTAAVSASSIVRRSPSEHNAFGEFDRGFERFDETCVHRSAECVNQRARRFLNHTSEPFFLYLHYTDPHDPYQAPLPYRFRFTTPYAGPDWAQQGSALPIFESVEGRRPRFDPARADVAHLMDLYDGEIAYLDAQLGTLLTDLAARGLLDRTLIVIAADHGEEFLEHGHVWHCDNTFETMLHVPLFIHLPGRAPRPPVETVVSNLDIAPTVLAALGLPIPPQFEGRSLIPLLDGKPISARPSFALQNEFRTATNDRYKLMLDVTSGERTLYDLAHDPGETQDVADRARPDFHVLDGALGSWLLRAEGTAGGNSQVSEEARRLLESLGYLK